MKLNEIEDRLAPMLAALLGQNARCRAGLRFIYIWWGPNYTVHSNRFTKKQALEVLDRFEKGVMWGLTEPQMDASINSVKSL